MFLTLRKYLAPLAEFVSEYVSWMGIWTEIRELPIKVAYLYHRCRKTPWPDNVLEVSEEDLSYFPETPITNEVVIAIHGSSSCPQQWRYTIPFFQKAFPGQTLILPNLTRKDLSFSDYFRFLDRLVHLLLDNQIRITHLIGTSMGGLLAAWVAEQIPTRITVLALNSPFRGAPALRFLPFTEKRYSSMNPDSSFLSNLQELLQRSHHRHLFTVALDDFQVPPPFGYTQVPHGKILVFPGGHTSIVIRPHHFWPTIQKYL